MIANEQMVWFDSKYYAACIFTRDAGITITLDPYSNVDENKSSGV